jgi:hypothetical protein
VYAQHRAHTARRAARPSALSRKILSIASQSRYSATTPSCNGRTTCTARESAHHPVRIVPYGDDALFLIQRTALAREGMMPAPLRAISVLTYRGLCLCHSKQSGKLQAILNSFRSHPKKIYVLRVTKGKEFKTTGEICMVENIVC